jgi:hypothetical protein
MKFPSYTTFTDKVPYGDSYGPFIRINPKYKYHIDLAIHEHEHVRQWYQLTFLLYFIVCLMGAVFLPSLLTSFVIHSCVFFLCSTVDGFVYTHNTAYRQYKEVKAFAKQIKFLCEENKSNSSQKIAYIAKYANVLSIAYNLNITYDTAHYLISKEM